MTELTVYLSPLSTPVTSTVGDINTIVVTLTVANNQATAASLPLGLTIAFAVDPGVTGPGGMSGPTNALLFSNRTLDPEGGETVQVTLPPTGVSSDSQWGIGIDQGNSDPTIVRFAVTPNGDGTIQPGDSVTFTFSDVQVNTAQGASTITLAATPPSTDTIAASPQIQKTWVELQKPTVTVLPATVVSPPSNVVYLSWSNTGAYQCSLSWLPTTGAVVTYGKNADGTAITRDSGWSPPMLVPPDAPVIATLVETTGFTLDAQGSTLVGQPTDLSTSVSVQLDPPILNAIAIPPTVSAVDPHGGDPAGGQEVTIIGTGFSGAAAVTFTPAGTAGPGGAAATNVIVLTDAVLTATVPAGTGAVGVTVSTPVGTSLVTPATQYYYVAAGQPIVTGVAPSYGVVTGDQPVTIYGMGFTSPVTVTFTPPGGTAGTVDGTVVSATEVTATVPAGTVIGTADVTVTTSAGTSLASPASQYTYIGAGTPFVTGVSPGYGIPGGGQPVAITGTGLSGASAVTFTPVGGGTGVSATSVANDHTTPDTLVTAVIPAGTGTVDVTVTTESTATSPGGTSPATPADWFSYAPSVTPDALVAPYQGFQLNWSSYTESAPTLAWGPESAAATGDPGIHEPVTVTVTGVSLGQGALPGAAGSAIAAIDGPTFFVLDYFANASPDPVRIDLTKVAPLALTGFDHVGPTSAPDGSQSVILTWTAENATAFAVTEGLRMLPALSHYVRRSEVVLPSSEPYTWGITAYGYDANGAPTAATLWHVIEPLPAQVTSLTLGKPRVTDAATGQQTVTLSWTAVNATSFTITGPGISVSAPASATSADVNLPLPPPPGTTMFTLTLTANGYVIPGTNNTAVVDVYPLQLQPPSIGASATQINLGESVTLSWGAEYATGFYLDGAPFPANSTGTGPMKPKGTTEYVITAEGYWPGTALPTAHVTVGVFGKEVQKDITDKRLPVQPRLLPGGLLPEDAEPDPPEPVGADGQPAGQQPFIGQDERPEMGARPRASGPTSP